jgi:malate dehydrogenase (oxaloacetate-decarboxylating)
MIDNDRIKKADRPVQEAMRLHPFYRGKIQMMPKCVVRDLNDFALWYTPGVAAPCKAIQAEPKRVYDYTNKANSVAIVSDGSRVLGLGNIGPEAGLPVMEGKALLFKTLGGVDAVPICLRSSNIEELIRMVEVLEPSFGGINLEDIAQPKCFHVLDTLKTKLSIPVWHDDQQGTATVLLAALLNALKLVNKDISRVKITMLGMGAANVATYRLLKASSVDIERIIACDSKGTLHQKRQDIEVDQEKFTDKWRVCTETNRQGIVGGIAEALKGADVCIAFSRPGPDFIKPEWIKSMGDRAIVFACANPVPEIWPWDAKEAGACIVATGRSDFPNQLNNSLAFPGIFRGVLDIRAASITDEMAMEAAQELAEYAAQQTINYDYILPRMDEWEVFPRIAVRVAMKAQGQGITGLSKDRDTLYEEAVKTIRNSWLATQVLMREGIIPQPPPV